MVFKVRVPEGRRVFGPTGTEYKSGATLDISLADPFWAQCVRRGDLVKVEEKSAPAAVLTTDAKTPAQIVSISENSTVSGIKIGSDNASSGTSGTLQPGKGGKS